MRTLSSCFALTGRSTTRTLQRKGKLGDPTLIESFRSS
jgi:hypothetical protein